MLLFWIIIALMLVLALIFVLWPLFHINEPQPKSLSLSITLLLLLPLVSITLYYHWGHSQQLARYYSEKQHNKAVQAELKKFKSPQQLINKMQQVLAKKPNSAKGWFLLGKLYSSLNNYQAAEQSYAKANSLSPHNISYMLAYAQANFFANNKHLSPKAKEYTHYILQKQPQNPAALNLLALNHFSAGEYQAAIGLWEKLLPLFPPQTRSGKVIMGAIHQAQQQLNKSK